MWQGLDLVFWTITASVFAAVAGVVFWAGTWVTHRGLVRQRFASAGGPRAERTSSTFGEIISRFDERRLGIDEATRTKQRMELIRAGYFSTQAVRNFNLIRIALIVLFPTGFYFTVLQALPWTPPLKFSALAGSLVLAYYVPEAYIRRRHTSLLTKYRIQFPDLMDLLVVSVDAGLSLEAALERIAGDFGPANREMVANLGIMSAEMRAGRSTVDALQGFSERLGLEEARALTLLLQQSLELGTDISEALRTYSDEMREKRMSRAEERAHALPVKLTIPLGGFIFPVIMIVVLTPVIIRLTAAFKQL